MQTPEEWKERDLARAVGRDRTQARSHGFCSRL